jgi:hypothetical protein
VTFPRYRQTGVQTRASTTSFFRPWYRLQSCLHYSFIASRYQPRLATLQRSGCCNSLRRGMRKGGSKAFLRHRSVPPGFLREREKGVAKWRGPPRRVGIHVFSRHDVTNDFSVTSVSRVAQTLAPQRVCGFPLPRPAVLGFDRRSRMFTKSGRLPC